MSRRKSGFGGLVALLVIVLVLAVGVFVVSNLTIAQLGLGDISISGSTLNEMNLGDTKVKDIFGVYNSLKANPEKLEKELVTNEVAADTTTTDQKLKGSSLAPATPEESIDYSSLLTTKVVYTESKELSYSDKEIGAILNNVIGSQSSSSAEVSTGEAKLLSAGSKPQIRNESMSVGDVLAALSPDIKEFSITEKDGKNNVRVVLTVNIAKFREQIMAVVPSILQGLIKDISDVVYFEANCELVIKDGELTTGTTVSVLVNNNEVMTSLILKLLPSFAEQGVAIDADNLQLQVAGYFGDTACKLINNLGVIQSIENGNIKLMTHTN